MEISASRYTAVITHDQEVLMRHHHDVRERLLVRLLSQIETEKSGVNGKIIDNVSGEVVYRCRKAVHES